MKAYKQTRKDSCGPSAMLITIDHLRPGFIPMTQEEEYRIHDEIGILIGDDKYTFPAAVCKFLLKHDFKVRYFINEVGKFKNPIMKTFTSKEKLLREKIKEKFELIEKDFSMDDIGKELDKDHIVMAVVNRTKNYEKPRLHWYVIFKHEGEQFTYADPLTGEIVTESKKELDEKLNLSDSYKVALSIWD